MDSFVNMYNQSYVFGDGFLAVNFMTGTTQFLTMYPSQFSYSSYLSSYGYSWPLPNINSAAQYILRTCESSSSARYDDIYENGQSGTHQVCQYGNQ